LIELPPDFIHEPPTGFSYEVKSHKSNVVAIWLLHHRKYCYSSDPVRTIWGFYNTKQRCYHAPINSTKHGDKVDIDKTRSHTAMQLNFNPLELALYS
jgi:hypothetical protein